VSRPELPAPGTPLDVLGAARENAWRAYAAAARRKPGGEDIRDWETRLAGLRQAHLDAIRACERARDEDDPGEPAWEWRREYLHEMKD
jgi:hypothetical protein